MQGSCCSAFSVLHSTFRTPAWLSSDSSSFVNCREIPTGVQVSPPAPFFALVAQLSERDASNVEDAGESPGRECHFAALAQRRGSALKTRKVSVQIRPWT